MPFIPYVQIAADKASSASWNFPSSSSAPSPMRDLRDTPGDTHDVVEVAWRSFWHIQVPGKKTQRINYKAVGKS